MLFVLGGAAAAASHFACVPQIAQRNLKLAWTRAVACKQQHRAQVRGLWRLLRVWRTSQSNGRTGMIELNRRSPGERSH